MANTTVSLSKWMDSCPLPQRSSFRGCRWALSLCLPLFHEGFVLHLRAFLTGMHRGDSQEGFWDLGQRSSVTGLACWHRCHNALHVASRKIRKTASVTHAWQSVITGALYCVFTLKVVQVSICLGARQRCAHRRHIQAASLVNVSSALACLTEEEHFFSLQQCRISSFPYAASAVFFIAYSPEITIYI